MPDRRKRAFCPPPTRAIWNMSASNLWTSQFDLLLGCVQIHLLDGHLLDNSPSKRTRPCTYTTRNWENVVCLASYWDFTSFLRIANTEHLFVVTFLRQLLVAPWVSDSSRAVRPAKTKRNRRYLSEQALPGCAIVHSSYKSLNGKVSRLRESALRYVPKYESLSLWLDKVICWRCLNNHINKPTF